VARPLLSGAAVHFLLAAYGAWLTPGPSASVTCDPIVLACFDRETAVLTTADTINEVCGDVAPLIQAVDSNHVAILSLYSFSDPTGADAYDRAFAAAGVTVFRRLHDAGWQRGTVIVTDDTLVAVLVALTSVDACPLGLAAVPAAIAR
jgi:hypothetical protein